MFSFPLCLLVIPKWERIAAGAPKVKGRPADCGRAQDDLSSRDRACTQMLGKGLAKGGPRPLVSLLGAYVMLVYTFPPLILTSS